MFFITTMARCIINILMLVNICFSGIFFLRSVELPLVVFQHNPKCPDFEEKHKGGKFVLKAQVPYR